MRNFFCKIRRYKIAFPAQFERMTYYLLDVAPYVVSAPDIARLLDFKSNHTVRNYIKYLKEAYLMVGVQKYSTKSKQRTTGEKLYPIDVAFMNQRENALVGDNLGWRLETIVLLQLLRKCKNEGYDIYYLRTRSGECDFIVCDGNRVLQCVQVSYDISSDKTRKREINGLLLAHRETKCTDLLLLTDHVYENLVEDGLDIKIRPVYEWCI